MANTQVPPTINLLCNVIPGREHRIEHSTNPAATTWTDLSGTFLATNALFQASDPISGNPQHYRILLLP